MTPLDVQYKVVASREAEAVIALLTLVQNEAADVRIPLTINPADTDLKSEAARKGAVAILNTVIDRLRTTRKNLEQRSGSTRNGEAD